MQQNRIFPTRIFTDLSRNRSHHRFVHDTRFSSPFLSLFFPSLYTVSLPISLSLFTPILPSFYTRSTMAVDYDQFKGYVSSPSPFPSRIFERFKLTHHRKPFQVISKLGVRYTGIFDHISQEDQTICLAQGMSLYLFWWLWVTRLTRAQSIIMVPRIDQLRASCQDLQSRWDGCDSGLNP